MGKIPSATTAYATAYLTEKGRRYLFNQGNIRFDSAGDDLLEIKFFTLSDVDSNYQSGARLTSGNVPDISGKNENCIKGTANYLQRSLVYQIADSVVLADPLYSTSAPNNLVTFDVDDILQFPLPQGTDVPPVGGY